MNVDYFEGQTRQPSWRVLTNELGEVPVLEVGGRRLIQSGAILLDLAEQFDRLRLTESERSEVLRWLFFDNHKFTANIASYRWLRTFAKPAPHEALPTCGSGPSARWKSSTGTSRRAASSSATG